MAAAGSTRVLWKGAIAFGLVHIPIALHSAVQSQAIDFDWLDRRSMEPVGYKRINKVTGKEIDRDNIVKGIAYDEGEYVVLESDEIASAYPRTTQTVEIEAFVSLDDVPFVYLERPYYVAPINKGGKVYALLRDVLSESRMAGLAKVVIQTKQHLALLFACGPVLILNLLRWGDEVRDWSVLNLPERSRKAVGLTEKEIQMARQLISDMTVEWQPDQYTDSFREQIMELVQQKIDAGETTEVSQVEPVESEPGTARIYDLTEMLQRSLKGGGSGRSAKKTTGPGTRTPADKPADSTPEPGKKTAKSASKTATKAAKKTRQSAAKSASKTAAKKAGKSASKAAVKKTAGAKPDKPASKTAARPAARKKQAA